MLHPSYTELINVVNKDIEPGDELIVQSRYSIVIATAKRARQLIEAENTGKNYDEVYQKVAKKPLSVAIDEVYSSKVKIISDEDIEEDLQLSEELEEDSIDESFEEPSLELNEELTEE